LSLTAFSDAAEVRAAGIEVDVQDGRWVEGLPVDDRPQREADLEGEDLEPREQSRDLSGDRAAGFDDRRVLLQDDLSLLDRRRESGVLELADDRAGFKTGRAGGNDDVVGRELPAASRGRGAGSGELLEERERVPFGRQDCRLVLDLLEERLQRGALFRGLLDRMPDRRVGGDLDRVAALAQLAAHRLERCGRDAAHPDDRRHLSR